MNKVRLGILGCGAIAPAYLQNFRQHFGEIVEVVACAETGRGLGTAEMAVAPRETVRHGVVAN